MAITGSPGRFRRGDSSPSLKARLLRSFVRRPSSLEFPSLDPISPMSPNAEPTELPQPRIKPVSKLSAAKALIARLRSDRNYWCNLAFKQELRIELTDRRLKSNRITISSLTRLNRNLEAQFADTLAAEEDLAAKFGDLATKHDKLVDTLKEKDRKIAKLKKSDRAKGKVHQRNLALKAALQSAHSDPASGAGGGTIDIFLEALAAATERIAELESTGERLLDALDRRLDRGDSSDDSRCSGMEDEAESGELGVMEAEVGFRNVLEDESFRESKKLWEDLLES